MDKDNLNRKANWLTSIFSGWGMKEAWAKILTGAIIGAAIAAGVLTLDSCTAAQVENAEAAHAAFHKITGKKCIFEGK